MSDHDADAGGTAGQLHATMSVAELADALSVSQRATVANPPLVAYTGVLLTAGRGRLSVSGSDGDTTITCQISAPGAAAGRLLVAPRPVTEWLSSHPKDAVVDISADGDDLIAKVGSSRPYRFRGLSATFPDPKMPSAGMVGLDLSGLAAAVAAVRHAADGTVRLRASAAGLWVEAADSYRAAATLLIGVDAGELVAVAPIAPVAEMGRHNVTSLGIDPRGRELRGFSDTVRISTRVVPSGFPEVDTLVGSIPTNALTVATAPLRSAINRLVAVAPDAPVRLRSDGRSMTLDAQDNERGEGSEEIAVNGDGGEFTAAVSASYFTAAVSAHTADELTIRWSAPLRPIYLDSSSDGNRNLAIVMPLKV